MKFLITLVLIALVGFGVHDHYEEVKKEAAIEEATVMIETYDLNDDGVLSEYEQKMFAKDLYLDNGGDETSLEELEDATKQAASFFESFDTDANGDLSYDEQLSIVQWVYEKYDNGEIKNNLLRQILSGYEKKVNDLNYYHELLNECGVPGDGWYIELRPNKDKE